MLLAPSLLSKWCGIVTKKKGKQKSMTGIVARLNPEDRGLFVLHLSWVYAVYSFSQD